MEKDKDFAKKGGHGRLVLRNLMMIKFEEKHRQVLRNIGYPDFDFEAADDDSFLHVYGLVEDELLGPGLGSDGEVNEYGIACEGILDLVADA
jgi:hypothetical protein